VQQGHSHFLIHLGQRQGGAVQRALHLGLPLLSLVGGLVPAVTLLGLSALGWTRRRVAAVAAAIVLGFLALALIPEPWSTFIQDPHTQKARLTLANVVYGSLGLLAWGTTGAVVHRLFRVSTSRHSPLATRHSFGDLTPRIDRFLVCWLGLEIIGYFALSPFPAARRVVGVVLVVTFLAGHLASRTCQLPSRLALVRGVAFAGVLLGLFFFGLDWREASAAQQAAELVSRQWQSRPGNTTWYLSWWGFAFYAERAGLKPLVLNHVPPRPGDVIAVQENPLVFGELNAYEGDRLELIDTVAVSDPFPLGMVPCYYCGRVPLEKHDSPRITVQIYRIRTSAGASCPDKWCQFILSCQGVPSLVSLCHGATTPDDR
jgi:hypothetical protein